MAELTSVGLYCVSTTSGKPAVRAELSAPHRDVPLGPPTTTHSIGPAPERSPTHWYCLMYCKRWYIYIYTHTHNYIYIYIYIYIHVYTYWYIHVCVCVYIYIYIYIYIY